MFIILGLWGEKVFQCSIWAKLLEILEFRGVPLTVPLCSNVPYGINVEYIWTLYRTNVEHNVVIY